MAMSTLPNLDVTIARQIRKPSANAAHEITSSALRVPSACIAGVAGALYVPQVGIINPGEFAPANSIEAVIWVAVGGRGTLTGAVLGGVAVNYAKTLFTSGMLAPYWLFMLGGLFVAVTLLMPRGIVGTLKAGFERRAERALAAEEGVDAPDATPRAAE